MPTTPRLPGRARPRRALALAVLLAAATLQPSAARAQQDPRIAQLVTDAQGRDYGKRIDAIDQLIRMGEAGRRALEPVLRGAEEAAAKDFLAVADGAAAAAHRKWLKGAVEDARKEALALIRDEKQYPDEAHGAAGQHLVDGAVSKLRRLWERPGESFRERHSDVDVKLAYVKEAAELLERAGFEPNRFDDLDHALAALDERFDVPGIFFAGAKRRELDELHEYNDTYAGSATDEERRFARVLNDYRVMLGLAPLELDERLVLAARKHSQEMADLDYFAHESPVEANRTPGKRAQNEGFSGPVLENCAVSGDAQDAFDGWYRSSGHHRGLVASSPRQLGIGQSVGAGGRPGRHWTMLAGSSNSLRGTRRNDPRAIVQQGRARLREGDADTRFRLAAYCLKNGLEHEGRALLDEVVAIVPGHARARALLGHVKHDGRWVSPGEKLRLEVEGVEGEALRAALTERLRGKDPALKVAALEVVRARQPEFGADLAASQLQDAASEVRVAACDALLALPIAAAAKAAPPLGKLLQDKSFYVRHAAAEALLRLAGAGGAPAGPAADALFAGLRSGDLNVRIDAHRRAARATGKDFGYAWDLADAERARVVDEWEAWWRAEGKPAR